MFSSILRNKFQNMVNYNNDKRTTVYYISNCLVQEWLNQA
jgi:hypothetical protein